MWYLTKLALRSRAATILIAVLLTAASIWATFQLKMEMIPDIDLPFLVVGTAYPDAAPDDVLADVTAPIEEVMWERWQGAGLKHLYSTSTDGISVIFADFEFGTDMDRVESTIREDISGLDLPPAVLAVPEMNPQLEENPQIADIDMSAIPLVLISLSGDLTPSQLKEIVDSGMLPALREVPGVSAVATEGGDKEQVLVAPDPTRMNEYRVSMYQVAAMLSMGYRYDSVDAVENQPMGIDSLVLGDVADVEVGSAPGTMISRTDGKSSVGIAVFKDQSANTVEVANAVAEKVEELKGTLGEGLVLSIVFDQSDFIEDSVWQLTDMALIGGALAILVVFFFLMAFRASLVTAISIPLSILIGFLVMHLTGITINLLTLSAMAIAVGRLIDNSIVVAEVVYRRLQRGEDFVDASIKGAREVANPITASTLATIAIFVPLFFVGGIVGEMFAPFGLTIIFALVASLLVALMVVPAFSKWFVRKRGDGEGAAVEVKDTWYQKLYVPSLRWALGHRAITLVLAAVLFLGSMALLPVIGTSFLPGMVEKMLVVDLELPPGTEIGTTSETASRVEALLSGNGQIAGYYTSIGASGSSLHGLMGAAMGAGESSAQIQVLLDKDADEDAERADLERAIEAIGLSDYVTVSSGEESMGGQMGFSAGLEIAITGRSYDDLGVAAALLTERLQKVDGLVNLESDLTRVVPKLNIKLDDGKIAALGLTAQQSGQLRDEKFLLEMGGSIPNVTVNVNGESYDVFVEEVVRRLYVADDPELTASDLRVGFGWPQVATLGEVADIVLADSPTHIERTDLDLSASLTGQITKRDVGAVNRLIQEEMDAVEAEMSARGVQGVEIKMGGVAEEMEDTFSAMSWAIMYAVLIAFAILAVSMRSVINPLIILVSLPLASIGALLGLLAGGYTLGMSGMMGVLMLVGIVLTNAIVLIALVEQLRKEGMATDPALIEAGRTRLRPILMTALTTMIAMVPLAFGVGEGTLIAAELAVVVIGGLFSSTLLTLLVIPVIYSLIDSLRRRIRKTA